MFVMFATNDRSSQLDGGSTEWRYTSCLIRISHIALPMGECYGACGWGTPLELGRDHNHMCNQDAQKPVVTGL